MKLKRFLINGAFLTVTAIITRTLGMFFRIYMSNTIGAEAIGLYELILTVYFFAVTTVTSGMCLLVTRLVTENMALGRDECVKNIVGKCITVTTAVSIIAGGIMFLMGDPIAEDILNHKGASLSIKLLAPSLPFIAVSACIRGYFYAVRQVVKTAGEQLLEQITEIGVFALLVGAMAPKGIEYACCAVAIGTTVSEVVTAFYSYIMYRFDVKNRGEGGAVKIRKHLAFIALPVTVSSCLRSGLNIVENATIPNGLEKYGYNRNTALSEYGIVTGMAMPLIAFPSVVIYSFASIMIPEMSEVYAREEKGEIQRIASNAIKIVLFFSVPVAVIFSFFGDEISLLFYSDNNVGKYICMLAPVIPLVYLDGIVDSMLKGLNQQIHYLSYNIADSVISVILVTVLVPLYGIMGVIIVMYVGTLLNTGLSLLRLIKVTEIKIKVLDWIVAPLIITVLSCTLLQGIL
ncbi:MAG: oligosaccharide flippase family protein [Acutalibacteraceae bacterium]